MSTVRYAIKITDEDLVKNTDLTEVLFDRRYTLKRLITNADGVVPIDLSVVGNQSLLYLKTSAPILIELGGGEVFTVKSFLFTEMSMPIVALQNMNPLVTANVELYVYGSTP